MRKHNMIWLTMIVLFLIETTIFHWIIPLGWHQNLTFSPRFVLVVILLVALFMSRHFALVLGLVFGLLHDIMFYGYMIGPYAFGMGLVVYLVGLLFRGMTPNFFVTMAIVVASLFTFNLIDYSVYRLFMIIDYTFSWTFVHHILPSVLLNLLFVLIVYIPVRYMLEKRDMQAQQSEGSTK